MKTQRLVWFFWLLAAVNLHAQINAAAQPQDTPYVIVSRDANSRVWQRTNWTQGVPGEWSPHVHKITELATGVCHSDSNGNYVDSSEAIALLPDGTAAATNCATAVFLPSDIGAGVIRLVTSDGKMLQNGPAYLAFDDGTNAVMIAAVTNSVGQLIRSNQVLYPDIFRGAGFRADLLCTVRKSGFESDVVFREQIPEPASLGLGANARIELLTEWFDTPEPKQTTNAPNRANQLTDVTLCFGAATIGRGKAFVTGTTDSALALSRAGERGTPVYKSWIRSENGQAFLVESVPYQRLAAQLKQLPGNPGVAVKPLWQKLFIAQKLPSRPRLPASGKNIRLAGTDSGGRTGVVLDYVVVSGNLPDYTFAGGTTYFISAPVYCSGNTTIGAGAIFKYPPGGGSSISIENTLTLETTPNNMAIFTAVDDDSVGQSMNGVPGSGYTGTIQTTEDSNLEELIFNETNQPIYGYNYAAPAIELVPNPDEPLSLSNLRIAYANTAIIGDVGNGTFNFANLEFKNCDIGFAEGGDGTGGSFCATNCLWANVNLVDDGDDNWTFVNCTFDDSAILDNGNNEGDWAPPVRLIWEPGLEIFYNCIFFDFQADSSFEGSNNGFGDDNEEWDSWMVEFGDNQVSLGSYTSPFQSAYLGDHYLSSSNPFLDAGNTTADQVGLFHYTTQTSEVKEANSIVDLGYHYLALNGSGNPVDTNGDGIPDYLEDANGNGIWDPGSEPNDWKSTSPDTSGSINLQVYTPLH